MPHEQSATPRRQTVRDASVPETHEQGQPTDAHEPIVEEPHGLIDEEPDGLIDEEHEWLEEAELPRRPRRRIISPIPLALAGVLLVACGFIAGVLVEKDQTSSSPAGSAASLASRFAALRAGASGAAASGGGSPFGGAGGATVGSVAYVSGDTLYVTAPEGNTVKVVASAGTTVTKTVKGTVPDIHPGESVAVTGSPGASGALSAETIRVGQGLGGGLGALFGGRGSGAGPGAGSSRPSGEPPLFGPG